MDQERTARLDGRSLGGHRPVLARAGTAHGARARAAASRPIAEGRAQGVRAALLLVTLVVLVLGTPGALVLRSVEQPGATSRPRRRGAGRFPLAALLIAGLLAGVAPGTASALTSIDFATRTGQFTLTSASLNFGSDLAITSAFDNLGVPDPTAIGLRVSLDPVQLTGVAIPFSPGITLYPVNTSLSYHLRLHGTGGSPEIDAVYDPGEFVVIFTTGVLSPSSADGLTSVTNLAPGSHAAYDALAQGASWDFSATLSAAGQNIQALLAASQTVHGSASGNVSVLTLQVIPEPGSLALLGAGLLGLGWKGGRRRG
jgi:hypothetical protein